MPKSKLAVAAQVALVSAAAVALAYFCAGCASTGTYAVVGDVSAPIELSDASDSVTAKLLFSMTGAKVWSAKDSKVCMTYTNTYTNAYFGIVEKRGVQQFRVEVEPLEVGGAGEEQDDTASVE